MLSVWGGGCTDAGGVRVDKFMDFGEGQNWPESQLYHLLVVWF